MKEHEWRPYKSKIPGSVSRVTHYCACGATKGTHSYKAGKPCDREELRARARHCSDCFRVKIVTQAFTRYICAGCGLQNNHPNGDTPAWCEPCSLKLNCCRKCGKSLAEPKETP